MKLKYIFADSEGDVNYTPRCTFFGYRFISINVSDKVVIKDIKSLPVTSISKEMEIGVTILFSALTRMFPKPTFAP